MATVSPSLQTRSDDDLGPATKPIFIPIFVIIVILFVIIFLFPCPSLSVHRPSHREQPRDRYVGPRNHIDLSSLQCPGRVAQRGDSLNPVPEYSDSPGLGERVVESSPMSWRRGFGAGRFTRAAGSASTGTTEHVRRRRGRGRRGNRGRSNSQASGSGVTCPPATPVRRRVSYDDAGIGQQNFNQGFGQGDSRGADQGRRSGYGFDIGMSLARSTPRSASLYTNPSRPASPFDDVSFDDEGPGFDYSQVLTYPRGSEFDFTS